MSVNGQSTRPSKSLGIITDRHQINVAITRARKGLVIIGWYDIYRATRMHSADYHAVEDVCPSVCLPNAGILSKRLYVSPPF